MKKVSPVTITGSIGLIIAASYLFYFLKKVDITLFYFWQQSIPLSLGESLRNPGGVSDLLADLFLEFMNSSFSGTVAIVLLLVGQGMSNSEIAERLFLSEGTVRNYVSAVLAKLQVADRTQAAVLAVKHGLV